MEETAAYANNHQGAAQPAAIAPLSKFEERKTKEKSRKVNTVTKFFTPSAKTPPKKGRIHVYEIGFTVYSVFSTITGGMSRSKPPLHPFSA